MNRRSFIKLATASSAAFGLPSIVKAETLGLNGATAPSDKITVGVIGTGGQGRGIMGNALRNDGARVVAVCDVDAGHRAGAKKAVSDFYKDGGACADYVRYEELLARKDIDAVLIATPDHWHAILTVAASRAGKHIYCEKPAATTVTEGRAMVDAVERAGIVCQIGSMQRSFSDFQRAIALARGGFLGKIKRVQVYLPQGGSGIGGNEQIGLPPETPPAGFDYDRWIGPAAMRPYHQARCHWSWRWSYNFAGGQLTDWIGHHYDCAALATGVTGMQPVAITDVTFTPRKNHPLYDTPTNYAFHAHYANGVVIEVSSPGENGLRIDGEEGWVFVNRSGMEYGSDALKNLVVPTRFLQLARGASSHMDNFLECARTGATPRCPIEDAHNVAAVAHLANACIRSGRSGLKWNPATETVVDAPDAAMYVDRTYRGPFVFPA